MSSRKISPLTVLMGALILVTTACAPLDASRSCSEYIAEQGATAAAQGYASEAELLKGITPAEELRVEEYLNYYEQDFPPPRSGDVLGMETLLGSTYIPNSGGEIWLQIGLRAAETLRRIFVPST
jgi:hypothetical protein